MGRRRQARSPSTQHKSRGKERLVREALELLTAVGIPTTGSPRALQMMALCFLAICDVTGRQPWASARDLSDGHMLKTREIITVLNDRFDESISPGSYDDIRRKHLKLPLLGGLVIHSNPDSAINDPTRAYGLNPEWTPVVRAFGTPQFDKVLTTAMRGRERLADTLAKRRNLGKLKVNISKGQALRFDPGAHNTIIKAVIEEFLPRFARAAELLYVGDASNKLLYLNEDRLKALRFFEIAHRELPDVIAYSESANWLFLVEAVHSSGAISATRHLELERLTDECTADIVYVTAFADRASFRKFIGNIAWETEVWLLSDPDHLIHFDGEKFLGPY